MLLMLSEWLTQYESGFQVFQYLTLRSILGTLTALFIAFLVGPTMIRRLTYHKVGQAIRDDGPESHFTKAGTPTMGGTLILVAIALSTLLWADLSNRYVWAVMIVTMLFGVIGFIDDYIKVFKKNKAGLAGKFKIIGQVGVGIIVGSMLYFSDDVNIKQPTIESNQIEAVSDISTWETVKSTKTTIPFVKNNEFDYA